MSPTPTPHGIAAVLLHGSPEYAPKDTDLEALLTVRPGGEPAVVVDAGRSQTPTDATGAPVGRRHIGASDDLPPAHGTPATARRG